MHRAVDNYRPVGWIKDWFMSQESGKRNGIFGVVAALLGVFIALAIVEFALGALKPRIDPAGRMDEGFILYDERLGWKLAPGWEGQHEHHDFSVRYGVNSLGFRGEALDFARPGSVMFLGDSFTFGLGVNDDEVFTRLLSEKTGRNVLNAGVPGYANDQQLMLLEKLTDYRPAEVVWVVYLGNDLLDNGEAFPLQAAHGKPFYSLSAGQELVLNNVPVPLSPKPESVRSRSVQSEILGEFDPYQRWQTWIDGFALGRVINQWAGIDVEGLRAHIQAHSGPKVELFMALVERGQSLVESAGGTLKVVLLPGQGYTRGESIPAVYQGVMSEMLEARLEGAGLPVLNLTDDLSGQENAAALFHPNEGHFNPQGHRWLAEMLAKAPMFQGMFRSM